MYGMQWTRTTRILSFATCPLSLMQWMDDRVLNPINVVLIPLLVRSLIPSYMYRRRKRQCRRWDRRLEILPTYLAMYTLTRTTRNRQNRNRFVNCACRCRRKLIWTRKALLTLNLRTLNRRTTICTCIL